MFLRLKILYLLLTQLNTDNLETAKAIRIEHKKDGLGIFSHDFDEYYLREYHRNHQNMNTPQEDKLNLSLGNKEWFCAYKSIKELLKYIDKRDILCLYKQGFIIYELIILEFQEGKDQFIYTKESIKTKKNIINKIIKELI